MVGGNWRCVGAHLTGTVPARAVAICTRRKNEGQRGPQRCLAGIGRFALDRCCGKLQISAGQIDSAHRRAMLWRLMTTRSGTWAGAQFRNNARKKYLVTRACWIDHKSEPKVRLTRCASAGALTGTKRQLYSAARRDPRTFSVLKMLCLQTCDHPRRIALYRRDALVGGSVAALRSQ